EKQRIAFRARHERAPERVETRIGPQHARQELVGSLLRERIETELAIVALAAPPVLVLRPVVDEQQEPRGGQAVDQAIQHRLGLVVDPLEVLDDQEEWLQLALPQQEALDSLDRPLPSL